MVHSLRSFPLNSFMIVTYTYQSNVGVALNECQCRGLTNLNDNEIYPTNKTQQNTLLEQRRHRVLVAVYLYLAVKKGTILILKTFITIYCHIKIQLGICFTRCMWIKRYNVVTTAPELCKKVIFSLKREWKHILFMFWNLCLLSIKCKIPVL